MIDYHGSLAGLLLADYGSGIYDLPVCEAVFTWTALAPGYRRWKRGNPPYRFALEHLELDAAEIAARLYDLLHQAAKEHQKTPTVRVDALKVVDKLKSELRRPVKTLVMSRATWRERFAGPEFRATGMRFHPPRPWARLRDQLERRRIVLLDSGPVGVVFGAVFPEEVGVLSATYDGRTGASVVVGSVAKVIVNG